MPGEGFDYEDAVVKGAADDDQRKEEKLKPGVDVSMVAKWESFFQATEYMQKVREVADLYPEMRSVKVVYADLDRFDADLAAYLLDHPDLCLLAGKHALKNLMHQEMRRADINLRLINLPRDSRVEIRDLRAKHVGKLVSVEGLVRKATEVRPKITDGLFQCLRCGHVIKESQEGLFFKEPMECYKDQDGCGRSAGSTKFKLLTEESRFVDTQKVEVQESPEGLRGGAQPERLTGYLEDDAAGAVAPGDRVVLNGILRSVQKGQPAKSTLFDINLDIIAAESQRAEYEDIHITLEDEASIVEVAHSPDVFKKIVASISPTIFGYDTEKEALALQLFGGVPKNLDDGTRIRGDIHILLIGDPGVAKCVTGDAEISMTDGTIRKMRELVDEALATCPVEEVDDGLTAPVDIPVLTLSTRGRIEKGRAVRVWKRTAPPKMIGVTTAKGRTLTVTPTHPLFALDRTGLHPVPASALTPGTPIATSAEGGTEGFEMDILVTKDEVLSPDDWVYDLEVEGSHNYIANGIVSHNSQMLRYMSRLAPRGIYASGKSSSAAGLCVAPDTNVVVEGIPVAIGDLVESRMLSPVEVQPGQWREKVSDQCSVATMSDNCQTCNPVEAIWRIKTPSFLVELEENGGNRLTLTPETKVWGKPDGTTEGWVRASDVNIGQPIMLSDNGTSGFRWTGIKNVTHRYEGLPPFVYDLTVKDSHSFLANGFMVHNTAAAVKDDFGEGRWTLEAGALVLADLGLASIDEMDKMTDQDRSSMHEAMESQCYDANTEVLTDRGWRYFRDVERSDRIAALAKEGELHFVKPTLYVDEVREGEMFHVQGKEVDLLVTPNHNMYVSTLQGDEGFGAYTLCRMDELSLDGKFRFQTSAVWEGKEAGEFHLPPISSKRKNGTRAADRTVPMDDWLELLGYYLSAGSVQRKEGEAYSVRIGNLTTSSKEECIGACIERLGHEARWENGEMVFEDRQVASYLASLGRAGEERIPRALLDLSSRQLRILYEALMLGYEGPGREEGSEFRTDSKGLADDLQELVLRLGMSALITVMLPGRYRARSRRRNGPAVPRYTVTVLEGEGGSVEVEVDPSLSGAVEKVHYKGRVYCVEVPGHIVYVRRNGRPAWCGNTVSVAKAGITATLQCRCSLLGAANPKYGRFQEHQYIADQINMPPALLSRFDLIFAMTDKPSTDKDANITQHILKAHRRGQVRKYADPSSLTEVDGEQILNDTNAMKPVLERELFRKYVAYSKKINPVLSDDAMAIISQFYLRIRKQGEGEGASVPITARQLEAFVRLSEASARARLSTLVTADDANRAVRIVEYYLRRIAGEGDRLDFDIIATGTSHSQREQIGIIKKLISQLSKSADSRKGVAVEEIYRSALAEGIAEDRAKTLIKRLGQNGEIYSPAPGFYKLASEG